MKVSMFAVLYRLGQRVLISCDMFMSGKYRSGDFMGIVSFLGCRGSDNGFPVE